jgi:hypothetical protein
MKKCLGVCALVVLMAAPAYAETVHYAPQVIGKQARKNIRHFLYLENLTSDKKAIYDQYGFTTHRVRVNGYGEIRETWTYLEDGLEFTFDACSRLIDTRAVSREARRTWAYQRDVSGYDEDICCDE